jgi:hypothetical protein
MLTAAEIEEWYEMKTPLTYESEAELRQSRDKYLIAATKAEALNAEMLGALKLALDEIHHPGALRHMGLDLEGAINRVISKAESRSC